MKTSPKTILKKKKSYSPGTIRSTLSNNMNVIRMAKLKRNILRDVKNAIQKAKNLQSLVKKMEKLNLSSK